jgi:uncharacterized protein (TIGR02996 family)
MRPELLALLRDAREHLDEDAPRLILADWLDDRNEPADHDRAELIRVQLELARMPERDRPWSPLQLRQAQLLAQHENAWLAPIRELADSWEWDRGLLRLETVPAKLLLRLTATEAGAWIEGVCLDGITGAQLSRLANSAALTGVTALELRNPRNLDLQHIKALLAAPWLLKLRELTVRAQRRIAYDSLALLFANDHLSNLTRLTLSSVRLTAKGAALLASSEQLANLVALELGDFNFGNEAHARLRSRFQAPRRP